jgi:hypothetical protein
MSRRLKLILGIIGAVVLVGGVGSLAFFEASKRAWIRIDKYDIRTEGSLQVGDLAPDLGLTLVGGETMNLSELWAAKPLVLTFGSYT